MLLSELFREVVSNTETRDLGKFRCLRCGVSFKRKHGRQVYCTERCQYDSRLLREQQRKIEARGIGSAQ